MNATAQLPVQSVRHDLATDTHLVVTLEAPRGAAATVRPPVCVVPVLDVSGSMTGAKLHHAKQSILKLVDHLGPGDRCGVVLFSSGVEVLAAPEVLTPERKQALKALVERVEAGGGTNLAGGLVVGLEQVRALELPKEVRTRVIVFTDGQANQGPATTAPALVALCAANRGGVTVSAFGYGEDADQDLLRDLSTAGQGNYAYVAGPDDALTAFARELGGLLSTYASAIRVEVAACEGVRVTDVVSDVDAEEAGGKVVLAVPELLQDEVRHLVLGLALAPRAVPLDAPVGVAEVEVSWDVLEQGRVTRQRTTCRATVRFVAAPDAQPAPDPALDAIVALAQLVRAQIDAEEAARAGRYREAHDGLVLFQRAVTARGHGAVGEVAARLADALRDEGTATRSRAYRASVRKGATRDVASSYDPSAEAELRRMGRARGTTAQERMEGSFKAGPSGGRGPSSGTGISSSSGTGRVKRRKSRRW